MMAHKFDSNLLGINAIVVFWIIHSHLKISKAQNLVEPTKNLANAHGTFHNLPSGNATRTRDTLLLRGQV